MARTKTTSASSAAKDKDRGKEPEKDKSKDKNGSKRSAQPDSHPSPRKRGRAGGASFSDARNEALDEAQELVSAVETERTPAPSPPPPPCASAADHAKAQELNALREVAAKAAADLARVTQELEREKKRNNAVTPVTSPRMQPLQRQRSLQRQFKGRRYCLMYKTLQLALCIITL